MKWLAYPLLLTTVSACALSSGSPAAAQQTAKVLATCGTATYQAGSVNYQTVDVTGASCGTSSGGGGGSTTVTNFPTTVDTNTGAPTASTLRVVTATGSSTIVTQPTASALNATVVGTGTLAVQNTAATPAGTNTIGAVNQGTGGTSAWLTNQQPFVVTSNPVTIASVTNATSNVALGAGGSTVILSNTGSGTLYYNLGTSNAVTATTSNPALIPGQWVAYAIGSNTFVAAITVGGATATLVAQSGSGTPNYGSVVPQDLYGHVASGIYDATTGLAVPLAGGAVGAPAGSVATVQGASGMTPLYTQPALAPAAIALTGGGAVGTLATGTTDGYQTLSVTPSAVATGGSLEIDFSPDNATWERFVPLLVSGGFTTAAFSNANVTVSAPMAKKYWRVQQTTYSSGTTTGVAFLMPQMTYMNVNVAGNVGTSQNSSGPFLGEAIQSQCQDLPTVVSTNNFGSSRRDCNNGALLTRPFETPANSWKYTAAAGGISNTTTAVTIAAADSSRKACVTGLQIAAGTLGTAGEYVVGDGATTTALKRFPIQTTGLPLTGYQFQSPVCTAAVNTAMVFGALTASTTGAVYINAEGYYTK